MNISSQFKCSDPHYMEVNTKESLLLFFNGRGLERGGSGLNCYNELSAPTNNSPCDHVVQHTKFTYYIILL